MPPKLKLFSLNETRNLLLFLRYSLVSHRTNNFHLAPTSHLVPTISPLVLPLNGLYLLGLFNDLCWDRNHVSNSQNHTLELNGV